MSLGRMFLFTRFTIASPARRNSSSRLPSVARIDPFPGRASPSASHRQFMLLAVNIPEHDPHVGHAFSSRSWSCARLIFPADTFPTPSNTVARSIASPVLAFPAFIGPPETNTAGTLHRAAAIIMPGTILSQLGMQTTPSKQWARSIVSTQSAISSRLASEYFIPPCPMAMPSSTPIVLNSKGTPPAARTASRTFLPTTSRCACPGMICTNEFAIAMNGLLKSASLWITPVARSKLRCGARIVPFLMVSLKAMGVLQFGAIIPHSAPTGTVLRSARIAMLPVPLVGSILRE
jgi:hypothetical protein